MHTRRTLQMLMFVSPLAACAGVGLAGDEPKPSTPAPATTGPAGSDAKAAPDADKDRERTLLDIAQRYGTFRLASPTPAWAIASCRVVTPGEITGVPSRSDDQRTHGSKIYKLWVSDFDAYMRLSGLDPRNDKPPVIEPAAGAKLSIIAPIGLTLVKETFESIEVPKTEEPKPNPYRRDLVVDGDHAFRQGAPAELFIMTKLDPKTPDTDIGWIYAVVSTDRKTVLRSGRIESCMGCHAQTTRDRLYGPERTWPKDKDGKTMLPIVRPVSTKNHTAPLPAEVKKDEPGTPTPPAPAAKP